VTSRFRRRRLLDRSLAALLAIVVAVIGYVVYRSSDIHNASLVTTNPRSAPSGAWAAGSGSVPTRAVPAGLSRKWSAPTDPALGAVPSEWGVVITTDRHSVIAHDAVSGVVRWTYTRSNRNLCAVGSGDVGAADIASSSSVGGIATVYAENGFCSQVMTFDPVSGTRSKVRTSPNQEPGSLAFGGSYAGWLGANRVEVWRYDLVRTIQYGEQINPPKSGQSRSGCVFTDLALAANQFATVEHCAAEGPNARVVLNFEDPGAVANHPDGWDVFQHNIRVDINTGSKSARIVGITQDRVAVLVSAPKPAVVVYDATGKETSRTVVKIPAAAIAAADSPNDPAHVTPAVQTDSQRFSFIGGSVVAISTPTINAVPPATSFSSTTTSSSAPSSGLLGGVTVPKTADIVDLRVDWVAGGARGLPATLDSTVLLPTDRGLQTFDASTGPSSLHTDRTIPVARGGYTGRVDVTVVGTMVIETRGSSVVALA
jgi:hypothetical protein